MLKTTSFVVLLFVPPFAFSFILFLRCCNFILDGHFTFTFLSNFDNVVWSIFNKCDNLIVCFLLCWLLFEDGDLEYCCCFLFFLFRYSSSCCWCPNKNNSSLLLLFFALSTKFWKSLPFLDWTRFRKVSLLYTTMMMVWMFILWWWHIVLHVHPMYT